MNLKQSDITFKITSYQKLISSIKETLIHGLVSAQKELEHQRLKTYWKIGKDISSAVDSSQGEILLGEKLYSQISNRLKSDLNLDISSDTILRAIYFSRDHFEFPEKTTLTFTHYIVLHRISDKRLRTALEKKAIKNKMSSTELRSEIALINAKPDVVKIDIRKKLKEHRGGLYLYTLDVQSDIKAKKEYFLDCGFKISLPIQNPTIKFGFNPKNTHNHLVQSFKQGLFYQLKVSKKGFDKRYMYLSKVLKVVDGDTLDVRIDVGFGIHLNERIRLKSINAPEIKTQEGKKAKAFLKDFLLQCPLIVIRTEKEGMYGRWLADVFALPKSKDPYAITEKGEFLNQVLLDKGFAKVY